MLVSLASDQALQQLNVPFHAFVWHLKALQQATDRLHLASERTRPFMSISPESECCQPCCAHAWSRTLQLFGSRSQLRMASSSSAGDRTAGPPPRRVRPPGAYLPDCALKFAAADERHAVPLAVRRASARSYGRGLAGEQLGSEDCVIHTVSAAMALLRFSDAWQYIVELGQLPEGSEVRKAPSRWGSVFSRDFQVQGVTDSGNKLYAKAFYVLECMAQTLGYAGAPVESVHRKSNWKKLNELCGDLVEAVLGRPLLAQHLATGNADTGYVNWTKELSEQFALQLNCNEPTGQAAARMLVFVTAVEDLVAVWGAEELQADEFVQRVCATSSFLPQVAWCRERITATNAALIRDVAPKRLGSRLRSAAGVQRQLQRHEEHKRKRGGRGTAPSRPADTDTGSLPSVPETDWSFGVPP